MPKAARIGDPIGHSPTMNWLLKGLLIGAGIALVGLLVVGTGGMGALAIGAVIGGMAAAGAGIGELMSTMSWAPKEVVGSIVAGASKVFINGRPAVRAHVDFAECSKHGGPKPLATGSGNVFINGLPAVRIDDKTVCSAVVTEGSSNVFIGGGTVQTDIIEPENLVPTWVHVALFAVGAASAVILAGPIIAGVGLVGGIGGGLLGSWGGGKIFGEGSDGQKWFGLAGSLIGGLFGMKGGVKIQNNPRLQPAYVNAVARFKQQTPAQVKAFYEKEIAQGIDHRVLVDRALQKYPNLTRAEAESVYGYTTKQWYRDFNATMENGGSRRASDLSTLLRSGVDKMPASPSTTQYRGVRLNTPDDVAAFDAKYQLGEEVSTGGYWSTAPTKDNAYGGTRNLIIETTQAKDISDLAFGVHFHELIGKTPYTTETIIPPGVKFRVVKVDNATGTVWLQEILP